MNLNCVNIVKPGGGGEKVQIEDELEEVGGDQAEENLRVSILQKKTKEATFIVTRPT